MAIYGVVMNQAVFMSSLGDNALATGYKSGEYLYSCSAIILTNAKKGAAALYHYPSGNIYDDSRSMDLIGYMIQDIRPTEAHVTYGATDYGANDSWMSVIKELNETDEPMKKSKKKKDKASKPTEETVELVNYLQGTLGGMSVSTSAAQKGSALVKIVDGTAKYSRIEDAAGITDLASYITGNYPDRGLRVYWKHKPY